MRPEDHITAEEYAVVTRCQKFLNLGDRSCTSRWTAKLILVTFKVDFCVKVALFFSCGRIRCHDRDHIVSQGLTTCELEGTRSEHGTSLGGSLGRGRLSKADLGVWWSGADFGLVGLHSCSAELAKWQDHQFALREILDESVT